VLALGFHRAAELLVEHWDTHGANDLLYVPIVYLHRHALELVLKQAIREAAACLRADGAADPDLAAPAIEAKLTSHALGHALGKLADELVILLARLNLERLPKETLDVLRSLHRADESGETFRYSTLKQGKGKPPRPARPDQQHIDIVGLANDLASAFQLLSGGVLTVLDEYHQWQPRWRPRWLRSTPRIGKAAELPKLPWQDPSMPQINWQCLRSKGKGQLRRALSSASTRPT
jgi:hypothetical protein